MLDLLLIIQAEHGGGNNSTFTVRVTSSTHGYLQLHRCRIGSLKGPSSVCVNIKVINMFHHLKEAIKDWTNVNELDIYLKRMVNKEAYDKTGLYLWHRLMAVYTLSDPRAVELKRLAGRACQGEG